MITAILKKPRTGARGWDLPDRYGPWKTAHERLRRWTTDGTWQRILDKVIVKDDSVGATPVDDQRRLDPPPGSPPHNRRPKGGLRQRVDRTARRPTAKPSADPAAS
nr:hypothetical protein GCM10020241_02050 [Streptoalloteichus tenebrarius]